MKSLLFAHSLLFLPLLVLSACGGAATTVATAPTPAAKPQIVYEGPGIPGTTSVQELFTANLDGSNLVQISHDGLAKFLAHFSPDGTHLIYTKFLTGKYGDPAPETSSPTTSPPPLRPASPFWAAHSRPPGQPMVIRSLSALTMEPACISRTPTDPTLTLPGV